MIGDQLTAYLDPIGLDPDGTVVFNLVLGIAVHIPVRTENIVVKFHIDKDTPDAEYTKLSD